MWQVLAEHCAVAVENLDAVDLCKAGGGVRQIVRDGVEQELRVQGRVLGADEAVGLQQVIACNRQVKAAQHGEQIDLCFAALCLSRQKQAGTLEQGGDGVPAGRGVAAVILQVQPGLQEAKFPGFFLAFIACQNTDPGGQTGVQLCRDLGLRRRIAGIQLIV